MLSPHWVQNVWRTDCKASAFTIYRFLEVYSENSSQHRRLWRHAGRTNSHTAPRSAALFALWQLPRLGASWSRCPSAVNKRDNRGEAPRLSFEGQPPTPLLCFTLRLVHSLNPAFSLPGIARLLLPIRFPGIIAGLTPPRRAAPTQSSFWEFTASTLKIIGMHTDRFL